MPPLDSRSIAAIGTLTALTVALLGLLLRTHTYPGFGRWTVGNLCVSSSLLFLCMRVEIPAKLNANSGGKPNGIPG
jgi:hypothetical protein